MDGISWGDLERDEQRAIATLGAGLSIKLCSPLLSWRQVGLGCCTQFAKRCRFEVCKRFGAGRSRQGVGCQTQSS
jgi:hypothetical protein